MATSLEMLEALLKDERLADEHRTPFEDMKLFLRGSRDKKLSRKQFLYVEDIYKQLELDSDESLNLVSSGRVPRGREVSMIYESMPKPSGPPKRKVE